MRAMPMAVLVAAAVLVSAYANGGEAPAADADKAPPVDAARYPQDTPQKALGSLVKALEARDLVYWLSYLLVPADTKRQIEKHGSLEGAVKSSGDEKHTARLVGQVALMKEMLAGPAPTEGEENGVKWACFQVRQIVLRLEKQPDGRWCMNTRVAQPK